MNRIVTLRELDHVPFAPLDFPKNILERARDALKKRNLRFDNKTGKIYEGRELMEEYVNPEDHTPHRDVEAVMAWEFSRYIRNGASRILRGFDP